MLDPGEFHHLHQSHRAHHRECKVHGQHMAHTDIDIAVIAGIRMPSVKAMGIM